MKTFTEKFDGHHRQLVERFTKQVVVEDIAMIVDIDWNELEAVKQIAADAGYTIRVARGPNATCKSVYRI
jgi:predicted phosphohydrolase